METETMITDTVSRDALRGTVTIWREALEGDVNSALPELVTQSGLGDLFRENPALLAQVLMELVTVPANTKALGIQDKHYWLDVANHAGPDFAHGIALGADFAMAVA